jgi:hypothetical protein
MLDSDGNMITGTIGPDREAQFKITRASLEGETITIEAQPGGALRVFEDGQLIGTISFQRVK